MEAGYSVLWVTVLRFPATRQGLNWGCTFGKAALFPFLPSSVRLHDYCWSRHFLHTAVLWVGHKAQRCVLSPSKGRWTVTRNGDRAKSYRVSTA